VKPLPTPLATPVYPAWWPASQRISRSVAGGPTPRISVVMPSFNQAAFLEAAIRSVLEQDYPQLEFWVIDGGSSDGSVDIIRHYAGHLAGWISEPDRGQVDAILKGLAHCTGDWFNWINSDDLLAPGALWRVAQAGREVDVVAGPVANFSSSGLRGRTENRGFSVEALIFQHLGGVKYHQPGIWLRRENLLQTGIERRRHYKFDHEMLLRYVHRFPRVRYLPEVMAYFRLHEQSKTVTQSAALQSAFQQEHVDILRELGTEAAFAPYRTALQKAARQCEWILRLAGYADPPGSRWTALARLWRDVRQDPEARCLRHSRKVALRLLRRGLWPAAWSSAARRRL
jgi:glycosyltransferase involved in cell wall biosynthesis